MFPEIDCRSLKKIFAQAKSQGMTVCADMTKRKHGETVEDIKEALEYVDYILPNEEEACLVTGKDTAEEAAECLLEAGVKNVVIKCGARGCLVRNRRECYRVMAKPGVRCIDTTGAGDSFAAGFIYALSEGRNCGMRRIRKCMRSHGGPGTGSDRVDTGRRFRQPLCKWRISRYGVFT